MHIPERLPYSIRGLDLMCQYVCGLMDGRTMAEIGVWTGAGTRVFSKHFTKIYAVDPWSSDEPEIAGEYNMAAVEGVFDYRFTGNDAIVKIKKKSLDAADDFENESLDMVYIDAIHELNAVRRDIDAWKPKVKKGGFLCGHDHESRFPGVVAAVEDNFPDGVIVFPDHSWVVRIC